MAASLLVGSDSADQSTLGWVVLGGLTIAAAIVLAVLDSRWFPQPPEHLGGAWMTGVFMRIAICETVFLGGLVMFLMGLATVLTLVAGLVVSVGLVWLFAAPTERNVLSIRDQLERAGGTGDIATLLSPRSQRR